MRDELERYIALAETARAMSEIYLMAGIDPDHVPELESIAAFKVFLAYVSVNPNCIDSMEFFQRQIKQGQKALREQLHQIAVYDAFKRLEIIKEITATEVMKHD